MYKLIFPNGEVLLTHIFNIVDLNCALISN